jgi:hypothetical protein
MWHILNQMDDCTRCYKLGIHSIDNPTLIDFFSPFQEALKANFFKSKNGDWSYEVPTSCPPQKNICK